MLNKNGGRPLHENEAMRIFYDVLLGMKVVQTSKIMHRDLKPENVFIDNNLFKIADFGFCSEYKPG